MNDTEPESGAHPIPIFDGSEDDAPEGASMSLHDVFFDIDSKPIDAERYSKAYPDGRRTIRSQGVCGLRVRTEFVGINHNPDPNGDPWIFETTVALDSGVVRSEWSTTIERAEYAHTWAVWVTLVKGPGWRLADYPYRAILWWRLRNRGRS